MVLIIRNPSRATHEHRNKPGEGLPERRMYIDSEVTIMTIETFIINNPAIIASLIAIIFTLATNIIYFNYRFQREKQRDFIKMQIDELLLPLYIKMKSIENQRQFQIDFIGYNDALDEIQYYQTISEKDEYIRNIAIEKLNLAPSKLSKLLLDFINYQYRNDSGSFEHIDRHIVVNNFIELRNEVFKEYEHKVKEYQNL